MGRNTKLYYIIEEIDIDGDKNHDGMLISQYKIDKYNDKIFLKNKYVSFKDFYANSSVKRGGQINNKGGEEVVVMTKAQYNKFMNAHNSQRFPQQHYNANNQPDVIINSGNPSFTQSVATGFGIGAGAAGGQMVVEGGVDLISSFFE